MSLKIKAVASVAASAALVLGVPAVAHADAFDACGPGAVCLWQNSNAAGPVVSFDVTQIRNHRVRNLADFGFNDKASSLYNHTNDYLCLYRDADFMGSFLLVAPNSKRNLAGQFDDLVSSVASCSVKDPANAATSSRP